MDETDLIRGDTRVLSFPIIYKNGQSIDINDIDELYLTCRVAPSRDSTIIFSKEKADFSYKDGRYRVNLTAADTEEMEFKGDSKVFYFDIEVTVGSIRKTRIYAINITKDYTIHGGDNDGN